MADSFTEVTTMGIGGRLMNSIKGVAVGFIMFLASFPLLWINEGCAVRTARSLEEGQGAVVSVPSDKVEAGNEGKLVHLTGLASTEDTVKDLDFGVGAKGIRLERKVEMYQWDESSRSRSSRRVGGSRTTSKTYTYKKEWSEKRIDSKNFRHQEGHENPPTMAYRSNKFTAGNVTMGAFKLSSALVDMMSGGESLSVDASTLPEAFKAKAVAHAGGYYLGADAANPQIGDMRVSFKLVKPRDVSVIARQIRDSFEEYPTQAGEALLMLDMGTQSSEAMFQAAHAANALRTWILRAVGFFVMFFGLMLIAGPIVTVADIIPFFGSLMGMGAALFAGVFSAALSLITVAIAWVFYRPVLGVALLGGAIALVIAGKFCLAKKKEPESV